MAESDHIAPEIAQRRPSGHNSGRCEPQRGFCQRWTKKRTFVARWKDLWRAGA